MNSDLGKFSPRIRLLAGIFLLWSGVIGYRLTRLQIVQSESMTQRKEKMQHTRETIQARRGSIYDRKGRMLAVSRGVFRIIADPANVAEPPRAAQEMGEILQLKPKQVQQLQKRLADSKRRYLVVADEVSRHTAQSIRERNLRGITIRETHRRFYPNGWLASHVLGFVNNDGTTMEGLEFQYHETMREKKGTREVMRDGRRRKNDLKSHITEAPVMGADLELTVDAVIQQISEDALREAQRASGAKNITAIVMNPDTGAILAMVNMPDFNPNAFNHRSFNAYERKNRAVVDVYEPGSAFKIVTVSAALDSGLLKPEEVFYCEMGGIQVFDRSIRDSKPFGRLDVAEILWHSSNVGSIKIAHRMKPETFYTYIKRFGFGTKTGVDLPAESNGILAPVSDWTKVSPAFLSLGHEISGTPLQMLTAASAIANGGFLVQPHVTHRIHLADGRVAEVAPQKPKQRIIKAETARLMRKMLRGVIAQGTAETAAIPGVDVFGKTGTAQRLNRGGYSKERFNASFVGFFPAESPRYGMIVVVHDPKGTKVHGGDVAAPVFSRIGRGIMAYEQSGIAGKRLYLSKGSPNWSGSRREPADGTSVMPNLVGMGQRGLILQGSVLGLKLNIQGNGRVISQWPPPGTPIPKNRICKVRLGEG